MVSAARQRRPRMVGWLLVRIFIGLAIGAGVWALTQYFDLPGADPATDNALSLGISVFVGGVVLVVELLLGVEQQMHAINREAGLYGMIKASDFNAEEIRTFVDNLAPIRRTKPPLIINFATAEINRLSGSLEELGRHADLTYDGEDRDWLLSLTQAASKSIWATSRGHVDKALWGSEFGQRYLEAQKEAIKRGVEVRRIFIVDQPQQRNNADFDDVLREQAEARVEVRTIYPERVRATDRALLIDFIVFDGVLVYHSEVTGSGDTTRIIETRLITEPSKVARQGVQRFTDLWDLAKGPTGGTDLPHQRPDPDPDPDRVHRSV